MASRLNFYSQVVESSSLVSVLFREAYSHPCISFFHLLVTVFSVIIFIRRDFSALRKHMLTKFISIGSYSPEQRAIGIIISSTKVFRRIICKTF